MITELSLYDYWRIIRRRKWSVVAAFLATLGASVFYTSLQPVVYETSSLIRLQPAQQDALGLENSAVSAVRNIESAEVAERAAKALGILLPGFVPQEALQAVSGVKEMYSASALTEPDFIRITASGADRNLVASVANAVADAYKQYEVEDKSQQGKLKLDNITARTEQLRQALRNTELARQQFLERNYDTGFSAALSNQLVDLELRQKELLSKYTKNHPEVIEVGRKMVSVKAQLSQLPARETELSRLTRDVKNNEDIYTDLNKQYEQTKISLSSIASAVLIIDKAVPPDAPVLPNRPRNYLVGGFLGLFLGVVLAFLLENMDLSINNIEDLERAVQLPVIGVIFTIPSAEPLRKLPGTLFRKIKPTPGESLRQSLIFNHDPRAKVAEPFHTLRSNILSKMGKKKESGVSLVFTSSGAAEGKTLCSFNFSIAAANAGLKVLLVDMDLRRPTLYRVLKMPREPGLSDVISGKTSWQEAVRGTADFLMGGIFYEQIVYFTGIDNLKILTSGRLVTNKVDILEDKNFPRLIAEWKQHFDFVVFDTPPVLLFVDATLAAKIVDAVVLVYGAGKMTRMALRYTKEQLENVGKEKLLGITINNLKPSDIGTRYSDYYYYHS